MSFLVNGATRFDEPGVFMSFEESNDELAKNVASLGYDLPALIEKKKIVLDHVRVERSEIEETGDYDLEGLFVRLGFAIDSIGARRVVLDTVESLFSGLANESILRAELRRLFRWLKDKGVTAVITGERGDGALTRQGLEEYVSDAVILLDHRVTEQVSTRRLRIVKYRGSSHGTNEYPFLIDEDGMAVLPITSMGLSHAASSERVSSGVARLDTMLGGRGYFRGSTILVSGTAGAGKSSLGAHFVDAACRRGERCLVFLFEESPQQVVRNMRSIGLDLQPWIDRGLLEYHASRPALHGLEMHLSQMYRAIERFHPDVVILDPVSSLLSVAATADVRSTLDPARGPPQDAGHHRAHDQPLPREDRARADGRGDLVDRRHLAPAGHARVERREKSRPLRAQVARDGSLQSDPRVSPDRPWYRARRRLRRRRRRAHGLRALDVRKPRSERPSSRSSRRSSAKSGRSPGCEPRSRRSWHPCGPSSRRSRPIWPPGSMSR